MGTIWYAILALLLIGYAVLDGFDLGVGALHLVVARQDDERRTLVNAIGPVWDGNEVWLIAWGAALFLAFPRVYAVGFSGFYLPLMIVLWLLMGRGVAIEFRHHVADPLWRGFWDVIFSVSSVLLMVLYGVAVGNVVTGVPLDRTGYFQGLFGWMLNPYALVTGAFSLVILSLHGASYLSLKTNGRLQGRARAARRYLWYPTVGLALLLTVLTLALQPAMLHNYQQSPILVLLPLAGLVSLCLIRLAQERGADRTAFLASAAVIATLLAATGVGLYPTLLPSNPDPSRSLTVANAAASTGALAPALVWIALGAVLLVAYQIVVYRTFRGKALLDHGAQY